MLLLGCALKVNMARALKMLGTETKFNKITL